MQFQNLNWDDLKVFLDVARAGNISKSAKRLNIDHSTASRRISQLELALGSSLFERSRTGLMLNELGGRLLSHVEAIESNILAIGDAVGAKELAHSGTVRIGTMEGIASLYFAERFMELQQRCSALKIELITSPQLLHVTRREADIFISFFRPEGRGMDSVNIGKFRLHLYGAKNYLDQVGTPHCRADLGGHRFVGYIQDLIQVDTVRWLDEAIIAPKLVFMSSSMISQMHAASSGIGLVLLPTFATPETLGLIRLELSDVHVEREIWLSVHPDLRYIPRVKMVVQYLEAQVQRDASFLLG
jgi:DNA-binding transcriptional LysR family regulator